MTPKGTVTVVESTSPIPSSLRSPFAGHAAGKRPNTAGQTGVQLTASTLASVTLISTWTSGMDTLQQALTQVFGSHIPQQTGKIAQTELGLLMRTGPEEFMLIGDDYTDRTALLRTSIAADVGSVTDLSQARCRIRIEGAKCRVTLNKLFALDLREAAFPLGDVAMTGTHHVPCALHRLGADAFDIYVFSTYAHDQLGTVLDAALEYGVALQFS